MKVPPNNNNMEFNIKRHVKLVVNLEIGEEVMLSGFSKDYDGKHKIVEIKEYFGQCESGVMIKLSGYDCFIDSSWVSKIDSSLIKKPSSEWVKNCGYEIIDADGWDKSNFDFSFSKEMITEEEFQRRLSLSTVKRKFKIN